MSGLKVPSPSREEVSSEGETDEGLAPARPQRAPTLIFHRRRGPSSDPFGATFSLEGEDIARGVCGQYRMR